MQRRPACNKSQVSSNFHHKLNAYTLGAAAAGVAFLAAAAPSDAEIIFAPVNGTIAPGSKYELDLNHDGVIDFTIENDIHLSTTPFGDDLDLVPGKGNAFWQGKREPFNQITAAALAGGIPVGPGKPFVSRNANMAYASLTAFTYVSGGPWKSATNRFLGLRFMINGELHYGWARLTVLANKHHEAVHATLTGYAYESEPNTLILTGKISSAAQDSQLNLTGRNRTAQNLGLLAVGMAVLNPWRRQDES